ncbi:MAG: HEAT repeat domain-containing protein [Syntrophorhabdales bacterium]|jgi:HEAT repeat protein
MRQRQASHRNEEKENERIERLIRSAMGPNTIEKEKAAKSLLRSPSQGVVLRLIHLLKRKEVEPRMTALELLKRFDSYAVDPVIDLLHDAGPAMKISACEILASLGHREALPHLLACLKDENPNVRNAACMALGEFRDDSAVEGLLGALNDEESIAFSAIYSMGKIASPRVIPQLWRVFVERKGVLPLIACEVLLAFKDGQVLQDLLAVLRGWSEERRDIFIRTILEKEDAATLEQLHETVGEGLFEHLARFILSNTRTSIKVMKLVVGFRRQEACDIILDALKKTGTDEDDFDELVALFVDLKPVWAGKVADYLSKEPEVLLPFIRACGVAGHKIAEKSLYRLFSEAPLDLKREIIRQLPNIWERNGSGLLKRALSDEDGHVQGDAALASARLGLHGLVPEILGLARIGFPDVRRKALEALASLDIDRATGLVESFVAKGSVEDKKVALVIMDRLDKERAFAVMKTLLADSDETVARSVIYTAGRLLEGDERYLEILNRLLLKRPVLHELLRVIRERKLHTFRDRLVALFFDQDRDVWTRYEVLAALAVFREHSLFDVFIGGLRDENTLIKIGSIKALSDLSDPAALPHVTPFARSQDATLRSAASAALKKLRQGERRRAR